MKRSFERHNLYEDGSGRFVFCPDGNSVSALRIHGGIVIASQEEQQALRDRWARWVRWSRVYRLCYALALGLCIGFYRYRGLLVLLWLYPSYVGLKKVFWTDWVTAYTAHLPKIAISP